MYILTTVRDRFLSPVKISFVCAHAGRQEFGLVKMGISSATRSRIGLLAVLQVLAQAVVTTATPFNWSKIKYLFVWFPQYQVASF